MDTTNSKPELDEALLRVQMDTVVAALRQIRAHTLEAGTRQTATWALKAAEQSKRYLEERR